MNIYQGLWEIQFRLPDGVTTSRFVLGSGIGEVLLSLQREYKRPLSEHVIWARKLDTSLVIDADLLNTLAELVVEGSGNAKK